MPTDEVGNTNGTNEVWYLLLANKPLTVLWGKEKMSQGDLKKQNSYSMLINTSLRIEKRDKNS